MESRLEPTPRESHEELMRFVLDTYGWRRLTDQAAPT